MARPMGIVIRPRHDARDVVVPVGSSSKLGRAQLPVSLAGTEDAAYVSRVQAVVSSLSQHASSPARGSVVGYLETPKEARNPTRLDKFDGRRVFVEPGNRQELHVGDGIGLLWRNDDIMAEVAWAAQPGSRPPQLDATGPSSQDVAANGSSVQQRVDGAGAAAQDTQAAAASGLPGAAQQGGPRPVMLMLCGAQGAGKSTFATAVVQAAAQHVAPNNPPLWVRVNQDSINDGERGTRAECVRLAAESLRRGASVLIDRCNFDRAQRYDFVALAHETGVEVHAIVLGLPLAVCRERVAARMDHEGGVQGDSAARLCSVPHSKLKADPPQLAEGLDSVCTCTSDRAVAKALAVVQRWRPGRPLRLPGADTPIGWTRVRVPAAPPPPPRPPPRAFGGSEDGGPVDASRERPPHLMFWKGQTLNPGVTKMWFDGLRSWVEGSPGDAAGRRGLLRDEPGEDFVIIQDEYPKSAAHALVIARDLQLLDVYALRGEHAGLVAAMRRAGEAWAREQLAESERLRRLDPPFLYGFHALPSMRQLHMHVISTDFVGSGMKRSEHWNSFNTSYFLHAADVEIMLRENGRVACTAEEFHQFEQMKHIRNLTCNQCGAQFEGGGRAPLSALKQHLSDHWEA